MISPNRMILFQWLKWNELWDLNEKLTAQNWLLYPGTVFCLTVYRQVKRGCVYRRSLPHLCFQSDMYYYPLLNATLSVIIVIFFFYKLIQLLSSKISMALKVVVYFSERRGYLCTYICTCICTVHVCISTTLNLLFLFLILNLLHNWSNVRSPNKNHRLLYVIHIYTHIYIYIFRL